MASYDVASNIRQALPSPTKLKGTATGSEHREHVTEKKGQVDTAASS